MDQLLILALSEVESYFDSQSLFKLSLLSCVKTPIASADLGRSEAVRRTSVASFLAYACFGLSARWVLSFCRLSVGSLPDAFRAGRCSRLKIIYGTPPRRRPCPPAKSQHDMSRSAPLANLRTTRGGLFLYGFLLLLLLLLVCSLLLLLLLPIPLLVLVGSGRRRRRRRVPSW